MFKLINNKLSHVAMFLSFADELHSALCAERAHI